MSSTFITLSLALFITAGPPAVAKKKPVTPASAAASRTPRGMSGLTWAPDGNRLVFKRKNMLVLYDAVSGEERDILDTAKLKEEAREPLAPKRFGWRNRRVRESATQWFPAGDRLLLKVKGDLFTVNVEDGQWKQLTATQDEEADPRLAPNGELVSFRKGNDLYVMEISSGKLRRLTRDGSATVWNARLDWVYPEELAIGQAQWWSPDSRHIAYLQFDVSREHWYPHADLIQLRAIDEPQRFPKAGTPNADVRVGVVSASGGKTHWLDAVKGDDDIFGRVDWLPDSSAVAVQKLNRIQNWLSITILPLKGKPRLLLDERDEHWVNIGDHYRFLRNSPRLLWSSERDGYRHLYLYSLDGTLQGRLTQGDWEVTALDGVDEESETVYFTATRASPLERHLYRVGFDGSGLRRITREPGVHSISMSPTTACYADSYSSMERPSQRSLHRSDGELVKVLQEPDRKLLEEYEILPAEILKLKARDGELLYARLVRPAGFEKGRKYPAIAMVYGGPHSQTIRDSWAGLDLKQVFAHAGFVVWQLDNRGSSGRGHRWETKLYRRFGKQELEDQLTGVEHLVGMGFVDPKRIGVYGWSYGGFMTAYALLNAPETFAAGVAGAPVTDWRNYDTIYTERYLGLPQVNEEGYQVSSAVHYAGNLRGHLLLIHNIEDDNVLFQNTMQLAAAFQKAGKQFDMMIYPQKTHGVTGPERKHLYRKILDYFELYLK